MQPQDAYLKAWGGISRGRAQIQCERPRPS
jgi:hypothetical protein